MPNFTQNKHHFAVFLWLMILFCTPLFSFAQPVVTLNEGEEVVCVNFEVVDSLEMTLELANNLNKIVMVYLYDNHDSTSREVTNGVFTDPRVIDLCSEMFFPIDGNIRTAFGNKVKVLYNIKEKPAVLFIGRQGRLTAPAITGNISVETLLSSFNHQIEVRDENPEGANNLHSENRAYMHAQTLFTNGERNPDFLRSHVRNCLKYSDDWQTPLAQFYLAVPHQNLGTDENMAFTLDFARYYQSAAYNEMVNKLPFYIAKFTEPVVCNAIKDALTAEARNMAREVNKGNHAYRTKFEALANTIHKLRLTAKSKTMLQFETRSLFFYEIKNPNGYIKAAIQYLDIEGAIETADPDVVNDIAWNFAVLATEKQDMAKALAWITKIKDKSQQKAEYSLTHAALLYRKGESKKSIATQINTATDIAKKQGQNHTNIVRLEQIIAKNQLLPQKQAELAK